MFYDLDNVLECLKQQCAFDEMLKFPTPYDHIGIHKASFMQFTGLLDKAGQEIFEGDIIIFDVTEGRKDIEPAHKRQKGIVTISDGVTIFGQWTCLYCNNKIIIGNVHQNPDLLK